MNIQVGCVPSSKRRRIRPIGPMRPIMAVVALILLAVVAAPARTLQGELSGAPYQIAVPDAWNGTLILYAHGYANSNQLGPIYSAMAEGLTRQGYAFACSGYADTGWAVASAVKDMEALREHFFREIGAASHTYIMGHSMGGTITVALIELHPDHYDGGLALCGAVDDCLKLWQENMLRLRVLYDAFFPGLPGDAVTFPEDFTYARSFLPHFAQSVQDATRMRQLLHVAQLPDATTFAGLMIFGTDGIKDLIEHAGGNPFDNTKTDYGAEWNGKVKRYKADPKAKAYMQKYRTPTGDLKRPLLCLHNRTDYLVPLWTETEYQQRVKEKGKLKYHALEVVNRTGHCAFNPAETMAALLELFRWAEHGEKPLDRL